MVDPKDGGYRSRKFVFATGTSVAILLLALLSAFVPAVNAGLDSIIMGLLGSLGIMVGSNVSNKFVTYQAIAKGVPLTQTLTPGQTPDPELKDPKVDQ